MDYTNVNIINSNDINNNNSNNTYTIKNNKFGFICFKL